MLNEWQSPSTENQFLTHIMSRRNPRTGRNPSSLKRNAQRETLFAFIFNVLSMMLMFSSKDTLDLKYITDVVVNNQIPKRPSFVSFTAFWSPACNEMFFFPAVYSHFLGFHFTVRESVSQNMKNVMTKYMISDLLGQIKKIINLQRPRASIHSYILFPLFFARF